MTEKMPHNDQTRRENLQHLGIAALSALGIDKVSQVLGAGEKTTPLSDSADFSHVSLESAPGGSEKDLNHFLAQSFQRIQKQYDAMQIQLDGAKIAYNTQESIGKHDGDIIPRKKEIYKVYFNRIHREYSSALQQAEAFIAQSSGQPDVLKNMRDGYIRKVEELVSHIAKGVNVIAQIEQQRAAAAYKEKERKESERTNI